MRHPLVIWLQRVIGRSVMSVGVGAFALAAPSQPFLEPSLPVITNALQLDRLVSHGEESSCYVHLQGVVAWANAAGDEIVLKDDSGSALVSMDPQGQALRPGQQVLLEGNCSGNAIGSCHQFGRMLVVDNDGVHGLQEKTGTVSLTAGHHSIMLTWFTRATPPALSIYYEGPDLPRQKIPASAWHRLSPGELKKLAGSAGGLDFEAYEGDWWQSPAFQYLKPVKTGSTTDIDLGVRTRDTNVAVRFTGSLEIPRDGRYTFCTASDGGSQFSMQLLTLKLGGQMAPPEPRRLVIGQMLSESEDSQWTVVEGVVSFVGDAPSPGLELELTSPTGHLRIDLADATGVLPTLLLHSRVQATGISRNAWTSDGQAILGALWVPAAEHLRVLEPPATFWSAQSLMAIRDVLSTDHSKPGNSLVHVRARACPAADGLTLLEDGTGQIRLQTHSSAPELTNAFLEVLATPTLLGSNVVLQSLFYQPVRNVPASPDELPTLTTVDQIKRLKRNEALRGYPVHVTGTITWSSGSAVVIQDQTASIYVSHVAVADADGPRRGESWEVEGITDAQFSPMIQARRVVRRGLGMLPEPLRPSYDQLINGSLDTVYVEVRGNVTDIQSNILTLLTHGGILHLDLPEKRPDDLKCFHGTLLRVRGCLWAKKDDTTHVLKIGEVEIHDPSIQVDRAAPTDPYAAPLKHPAELLLFDAQAGSLEPVKVCGQILLARGAEYRLLDGEDGLRFEPKAPLELLPGDRVEVVGFPELGGPSPLLRQAHVRKIGFDPLPAPKRLSEEALFDSQHDATLVQVEALLLKLSSDQKDQILGLQMGSRSLVARINAKPESVQSLRLGSRLQLTGVYSGRGAWGDIHSFELLLNYPSDIRVIAQPPWWTLRRLLGIFGVLLGVLGIAAVWIGLLRRQVEQRTVQLRNEIQVREKAEHLRAVEAERARIARDLHDDLGSSLTEISLLADAGPGWPPSLDRAGQRFQTIADKARAVVKALDVIVWLVNPRQDSLPFLASYVGSYTEEYLSASGVACRLKIPLALPSVRLTAEIRHSLFLAVKESLRNVVRHAHASEVLMELTVAAQQLQIVIADNGRGFDRATNPSGNGLSNLQERLAGIGGGCEIHSQLGAGTKVSMTLPLPPTPTDL